VINLRKIGLEADVKMKLGMVDLQLVTDKFAQLGGDSGFMALSSVRRTYFGAIL
jgi:hypothetical protein